MLKRSVVLFGLVCASVVLNIATPSWTQVSGQTVSSWPPDLSPHMRETLPDDIAVSSKGALVTGAGPRVTIIDVNRFNFSDGSEPSIAINSANPRQIVVNGGFGGWGLGGTSDVRLFVSSDGGNSWNLMPVVSPPKGILNDKRCPCDTTLDFGRSSALSGTFLAGASGPGSDDPEALLAAPSATATPRPPDSLFSGTSVNLSSARNWGWFVSTGRTQLTNHLVAGSNPDQPWLLVNRGPVVASQDNIYVAYDDLRAGSADMRVAVATNTNPPNFVRDRSAGVSRGAINPGTRLAVDRSTGWVYDLFQDCPADSDPRCRSNVGRKTINYILNRSTDGGQTWRLNGSASGVKVASAPSTQPFPKFGTVNALLGGIDHVTVDPNNGDVYVVYANQGSGNQLIVIRRLVKNSLGGLNIGPERKVSVSGVDAALPSVAVAGGTLGVLYTTFDRLSSRGLAQFSAHFATSTNQGNSFSDQILLTFLSPVFDNDQNRQRVLGDYQQLKAVGSTFYGVFTGNGAALRRRQASSDPIFFTTARGPASTPAPTPTRKPAATPTPRATPIGSPTLGAEVSALAVANSGSPGETEAAGSFTVTNTLKVTESISSATISVSDPGLFSTMTLSGAGQSVVMAPPGSSTTFTFTKPITLAPGGSVTFFLSGVISTDPAMLTRAVKFAGLTLGGSLRIESVWPLEAGMLLLGIALLGLEKAARRRAVIMAVLALGLAAASVGCKGNSNNFSPFVSTQQVTGIADTGGGASVQAGGLPATLGTITG